MPDPFQLAKKDGELKTLLAQVNRPNAGHGADAILAVVVVAQPPTNQGN
jgi:hypothetical protein